MAVLGWTFAQVGGAENADHSGFTDCLWRNWGKERHRGWQELAGAEAESVDAGSRFGIGCSSAGGGGNGNLLRG